MESNVIDLNKKREEMEHVSHAVENTKPVADARVRLIPVDEICLNPVQPRKKVDEEKIDELAESIKQYGVLQPVILTIKEGLYHLVIGERRLRAARKAGIARIPALVRDMEWDEMLKVALVENLQREDLAPLEEARSYRMLMREYELTQEEISNAIGRSRPYVANMVRLLNLPKEIMDDLESGGITAGHARALLGLESERRMLQAANRIKKHSLSVRQTEELVKKLKEKGKKGRERKRADNPFAHVQDRLSTRFSTRVTIRDSGKKGKIEFHYNSKDELDRLLNTLGGEEKWI